MSSIQSASDKALIYMVREGSLEALDVLVSRFAVRVSDPKAVMWALKRMRVVTVNAAKRIIFANADMPGTRSEECLA